MKKTLFWDSHMMFLLDKNRIFRHIWLCCLSAVGRMIETKTRDTSQQRKRQEQWQSRSNKEPQKRELPLAPTPRNYVAIHRKLFKFHVASELRQ